MSELIETLERRQVRQVPDFRVGDRVRVHFQVVEGTRRRTQVFEGVVLKEKGGGPQRTFTVRKLSFGVGVERTFPVHSPKIERIEVVGRGEVRRAKLYYLRGRVGRRARLREMRDFRPEEVGMIGTAPEAADGAGEQPAGEQTAEEQTAGEQTAEEIPAGEESVAEAPQEPTAEADASADPEPVEAESASAEPEAEPAPEADPEPAAEADAEPPAAEAQAEEPAEQQSPRQGEQQDQSA